MATAILVTVIFCGLCFSGASAGIRFEKMLPLCSMGIVALLFLSGMTGSLAAGFYILLALSVAAPVYAVIRSVRRKDMKETLSRFLTPSFYIFLIAAAVIAYLSYDKVAYMWDEMDHWMYVVKTMVYNDDFGTNPASYDMYASYPPGMALLQYFTSKLDSLLHPGQEFTEWLCYYTYHLFAVSLLIPLFPGFGFKKAWKNAVFILLMEVLSATVFRQEIFTILIDPFVGLAAGAGFIAVMFTEKKDVLYRAYMCLLCAMLVLAKDVGLAAGGAVAFAYFLDSAGLSRLRNGKESVRRLFAALLPMISALCAKALWALELRLSDTEIQFSEKADHLNYAKIFFFGGGDDFRQKVADNYKNELLHGSFIEARGIRLSISAIFIASCLAAAVLLAVLKALKKNIRKPAAAAAVAAVYGCIYIIDMGAVYMYKFKDYEALELASLWRYIGIALLPLIMICAALGIYTVETACELLSERENEEALLSRKAVWRRCLSAAAYTLIIAAMLVLSLSSEAVLDVVSRRNVALSHEKRAPYESISAQIKSECGAGDRIYMIIQDSDVSFGGEGYYDNMVIKANVYPIYIDEDAHSLGTPDGDGYVRDDIPFEQWNEDILENYDYVAVFRSDRMLADIYGEAFGDVPDIASDSLYRVNRDSRVLEPVGADSHGE